MPMPTPPAARRRPQPANARAVSKAEGLLKARCPQTASPPPRGAAQADSGVPQTDPKLSKKQDDDGRYPIHWAASSNDLEIVALLTDQAAFDPDVQVRPPLESWPLSGPAGGGQACAAADGSWPGQDASGWTPLMIAASVPDGEPVLKLLLQRGADVNEKSKPARPPALGEPDIPPNR